MTETVSVYEAKTHLSALLARVEAGEEIIISRNGKPVARMSPAPVADERRLKAFGMLKGRYPEPPDGWDDFTEQDALDWYGGLFPVDAPADVDE